MIATVFGAIGTGATIVGAAAPGRHERLELRLGEPFDAAAPGQTAVLMDGETIVGHGTIVAAA